MVEFLRKIFFGFAFLCLVNCNDVVHIPSNEPVYETQRSLILPMTLTCPLPKYKFIEVRGVTLVNDTNVIVASARYPNIDRASNEECLASLSQTADQTVCCNVLMKDFSFDNATKLMDKVVTFDCREKPGGDSSNEIKTVSKEKDNIEITCPDKDAVPQVIDIYLANGRYVDLVQTAWKCNEENVRDMGRGNGGGHCHVQRPGYLNESSMTVKFTCSNPPRRNIEEFIEKQGTGNQEKKIR